MGFKDTIKGYFQRGDKPKQAEYYEWMDKTYFKDETIPVGNVTVGEQELVCDATTVFDYSVHSNARVTLSEDTTLSITNMAVGNFAAIIIQQDGTGGWTFTYPAGSQVAYNEAVNDTADAFTLVTIYRSTFGYFITVNNQWTEQ